MRFPTTALLSPTDNRLRALTRRRRPSPFLPHQIALSISDDLLIHCTGLLNSIVREFFSSVGHRLPKSQKSISFQCVYYVRHRTRFSNVPPIIMINSSLANQSMMAEYGTLVQLYFPYEKLTLQYMFPVLIYVPLKYLN